MRNQRAALANAGQQAYARETVLRLFGQAVDPRDAANLAVALLADGRRDAVSAAVAIETALPAASDVLLTDAQREAVADVVENHTRSLSKLQSLLAGK